MDSDDEVNSQLYEKFQKTTLGSSAPIHGNNAINDYFAQPHREDPDTWTSKPWILSPEIPSSDEILGTDEEYVDLIPNKLRGAWESKDAYLKAHYELLREDAVAPLRDAVAMFRNNPNVGDNNSVSIYEKVHFTGLTFARRGLAFRIQFSTHRAGKNIAWEYSKRLISGSIVALSPADDAFQINCVVAIVAARPLEGVQQQPPEIDIFFANPEDANFDPQLEWIMVEAKTGYYESARHTMTALQKMSRESFPLAEHICFLNPEIGAPEYVKDNPMAKIESAINNSDEEEKIDILNGWPQAPVGDLDFTQWVALNQMLTKQLAIIQGPPGTGKTYVSVVALRILLSNMKPGDPPIVVASQTNHALDQLLTHVSQFETKYIRLGGRCSDPEIKKRTLFAIRRDEPMPAFPGSVLGTAHRNSRTLSIAISDVLQPFNEANSDMPLPSSAFMRYGLLTAKQFDYLEKGAKRWVCAGEDREETDPLITWLGDQAVRFEVNYTRENFGFAEDEVDLEYEQLKELEVEQSLNDDGDYEILRGSFTFIREGYYGRSCSPDVGSPSSEYLDYDDMWKIPVLYRGWVYNELREQLKGKVLYEFRQLLARYSENCKSLQIGGWERDHLIVQDAKVLGMTTTGLSKYRALISSVRPRTVLIEEAAETIEAPIAAACLDSLQQLILVGDHQQLRGHCSMQDLEGDPFYLDVSMFERLVKNEMHFVTLQQQRRMAPEICRLLYPIYGALEDHKSVKQREEVPGMGKIRAFFFSHCWPESFDDMSSKFNEKEAEMIMGFFVYLVLNSVAVKDITILTFYNGQRKKLLKLMRNHPYLQGHYVKVVTVDSYQGEENEVVILSLVRSGGKSIGFLSTANRVCVALSRARRGFYMFGNAELLTDSDPLWEKVLRIMGNKDAESRIGFLLPLTCVKHKNRTLVKDPADWRKANGGCELACNERLNCGHKCSIRCHSFSHDQVQCREICNRQMDCQHVCKMPCATSHACSCNCEGSRRLEPVAPGKTEGAGNNTWGFDEKENKRSTERRMAIENYQAYARGGSKHQDAVLDQMAEELQPVGPKLSMLLHLDRVGPVSPKEPGFEAESGRETYDQERSRPRPQQSLLDDW